MTQRRVRAVYMRGGTSRCLCFHAEDLPEPGRERDSILLAALGSPDPYGRQLDGLGGGISSLSKACIIGPPTLPGADVDYTFAQVEVKKAFVDYAGNCGNCSSAVGPFAIDEGLVRATEGVTRVRIHNTNTKKLIVAHVPVEDGEAAVRGDFELAGVGGRGARIALDFVEPGGAGTGRLLPTGRPRDVVAGVEVSCVDATNPVVFVRARDLGLTGTETPQAIDADHDVSARLEKLRVEAAARMGMPESAAVPKIAFVAPPTDTTALDGVRYPAEAAPPTSTDDPALFHGGHPGDAAPARAGAERLGGRGVARHGRRRHFLGGRGLEGAARCRRRGAHDGQARPALGGRADLLRP